MVLAILLVSVAHAADEKLTTYENKQHRFRLSYPAKLTPMDVPSKLSIVYLGTEPDGPDDNFRESVMFKRETPTRLPDLTFDQALNGLVGSMNKAGIKVVESTPAKLGGLRAQRILYTHQLNRPEGDLGVKAILYFVYKDNQPYSLDIRATEQTFDRFAPIAQKVVDSFQWTDATDGKER